MEENKPLIERLNFEETELFLDGNLIFTTPETHHTTREINVIGVDEERGEIDIGTGRCCYGHIYRLQGQEEKFKLEFLTPINFNVYDLMPIQLESPDNTPKELQKPSKVLATGYGCHGSGVRLVSLHSPSVHDLVIGKEFDEVMEKGRRYGYGDSLPKFTIENNRVLLDINSGYYDNNQLSKLRYPKFVPYETTGSIDLTDRLRAVRIPYHSGTLGIDFEKTIEAANKYQIKRR